jgi:hypothetical protein
VTLKSHQAVQDSEERTDEQLFDVQANMDGIEKPVKTGLSER